MARTIGNNVYYEDENPYNTLLRTGIFAGAGVAAYKNRTKILDVIAPIQKPILSAYESGFQNQYSSLKAMAANAAAMRATRDRIFHSGSDILSTPGVVRKGLDFNTTDIPSTSVSAYDDITFKSLDDVVDAAGNNVGWRVKAALERITGQTISNPTFNGTNARFTLNQDGTGIIDIKFGKYNSKSGTFVAHAFGTSEALPTMADVVNFDTNGFSPGLELYDWNTGVLRNLENPDALKFLSAQEGITIDQLSKISEAKRSVSIEAMVEKQFKYRELDDIRDVADINRAMKNLNRRAESIQISNHAKQGMVGSQVIVSGHSRLLLEDKHPDIAGFGKDRLGASSIGVDYIPSGHTAKSVRTLYDTLPSNVRSGKSHVFVGANGVLTKDSYGAWHEVIERGIPYFGATGSSEQIASGNFTIRRSPYGIHAESQKSEKGLMFMMKDKTIRAMNRGLVTRYGAENAERMRYLPTVFNPEITPVKMGPRPIFSGAPGYEGSLANTYQYGSMNFFGVIDNASSGETIRFSKGIGAKMLAGNDTSHKITGLLSLDGDISEEVRRKLEVEFNIAGRTERAPLSKIFYDTQFREEFRSHAGSTINIKKGQAIGTFEEALQVKSQEALRKMQENPHKIVTASTDMIMDWGNVEEAYSTFLSGLDKTKNTGMPTAMKVTGIAVDKVGKVGVLGGLTRSAMHIGLGRELTNTMLRQTGMAPEMAMSIDLFKSIIPDIVGGKMSNPGKGSAEFLLFLQNSIAGHIMANPDTYVKLRDEALEKLRPHINFADDFVQNGSLNLTEMFRQGKLSFRGEAGTTEAFAEQLRQMAGLAGIVRNSFVKNKSAGTTSLSIRSIGDKEIQLFHDQWSAYKSDQGYLPKWAWWGGITPTEYPTMSQGRGFNTMKIGTKDLPSFMNKQNILAELSLWNINDTIGSQHQIGLLANTWGKDVDISRIEQIAKSYEGHVKALNPNFNGLETYSREELVKKFFIDELDSFNPDKIMRGLRRPEAAMGSLLSIENNRFGFWVEDPGTSTGIATKRFVPSADFLGGVYVQSAEKGSTGDFARSFIKDLLGFSDNGDIEKYRANINSNILMNIAPTNSEGFSATKGLAIADSLYLENVQDMEFLHNAKLSESINNISGADDAVREFKAAFGSIAIQSKKDFRLSLEQLVKNVYETARDDGTNSMSESFNKLFGEGNHIMKTYGNFFGNGTFEAIDSGQIKISEIVGHIRGEGGHEASTGMMAVAERNARALRNFFTGVASKGDLSANDISRMNALLERTMGGISIRYPNIYPGSTSAAWFLPDTGVESLIQEGSIAQGSLLDTLQRADYDGDKMMTKWTVSQAARQDISRAVRFGYDQSKVWMEFGRGKGNVFDAVMGSIMDANTGSASISEQYALLASAIKEKLPVATAQAQFLTKAGTGTLNIRGLAFKNLIRSNYGPAGLPIEHVLAADAYFGTMTPSILEQAKISSKHTEFTLDLANKVANGKIENVVDLIGATFGTVNGVAPGLDNIKQSIRQLKRIDPYITLAASQLYQEGSMSGETKQLHSAIETFVDMQTHFRRVSDNEARAAVSTIWGEQANIDDIIKNMRTAYEGQLPFLETEAGKAMFNEETSFLRLLGQSMFTKDDYQRAGINASDDILTIIKTLSKIGNKPDAPKDIIQDAMNVLFSRRLVAEEYAMTTNIDLAGHANERRMLRGWPKVTEFLDNALKKHPGKVLAGVGAGLIIMRALNITSGDGTPYDPEDLPSYGNASFEAKKVNGHGISPRVMSSEADYNSDSDLLTDNTASYDDSLAYARSNGYTSSNGSTISIRHDGHNPYSSDMMLYG